MLYQEDLSEAFYRHDLQAIAAGFCALVGGEDAQGVEAPDTALLIGCCRALADHDGTMPVATVDAINAVTRADRDEALTQGATYAAGAARVWKDIERFAPMFGEMPGG